MHSTFLFLVLIAPFAAACTSMAISPGASFDGSSFVTYNADDWDHYGFLNHFPAGTHPNGTVRKIYDSDSRAYLGEIPEAPVTFNVVHYANEFGVSIGESTFGGVAVLATPYPGSIMDYGSLMVVALQRSRSARELIGTMDALVQQYGYASSGESFSIADSAEAWIMEIVSRGPTERGAVWVARRLPDGFVTAHANQARITTFPRNDPDNCLYSPDIVDFAKRVGLYPASGSDEAFSFSDVFDPVSPGTARWCEARVWALFHNITAEGVMDPFLDYARGWNLTNRMPLWVKPAQPLTLEQLFGLMKNNFANTFFAADDSDMDDGAGFFRSHYRPRGLSWQYQGQTYTNERPVATQQTFTNMVVQIRQGFPTPALGTVVWFGVDGSMHTCRIPLYAGLQDIPRQYAFGVADSTAFSFESAFWVTNMVANLAYSNMQLIDPEVQAAIAAKFDEFKSGLALTDAIAVKRWQADDQAGALAEATAFSKGVGEKLIPDWLQLWQRLFMKYFDWAVHTPVPGSWAPQIGTQQVAAATYRRVATETGDKYLLPNVQSAETEESDKQKKIISKRI